MERARSEWLRSLDVEQDTLLANEGIIFMVRAAHLEYLKPARFNDTLEISVAVAHLGRASVTFEQQVTRVTGMLALAAHPQAPVLCCAVAGVLKLPVWIA